MTTTLRILFAIIPALVYGQTQQATTNYIGKHYEPLPTLDPGLQQADHHGGIPTLTQLPANGNWCNFDTSINGKNYLYIAWDTGGVIIEHNCDVCGLTVPSDSAVYTDSTLYVHRGAKYDSLGIVLSQSDKWTGTETFGSTSTNPSVIIDAPSCCGDILDVNDSTGATHYFIMTNNGVPVFETDPNLNDGLAVNHGVWTDSTPSPGSSGQVWTSNGASKAPTWHSLPGDSAILVSAPLGIVRSSKGDSLYITAASSGYLLTANGAGNAPTWQAANTGTAFPPAFIQVTGRWYHGLMEPGTNLSQGLTANIIYAIPWYWFSNFTADSIGFGVANESGADSVDLGIYSDTTGITSGHYPNALLYDAGKFNVVNGSTGFKERVISPTQTLTGGQLYWLVIWCNTSGATTANGVNGVSFPIWFDLIGSITTVSACTVPYLVYYMTKTFNTGGLPATFSTTVNQGGTTYSILLRAH